METSSRAAVNRSLDKQRKVRSLQSGETLSGWLFVSPMLIGVFILPALGFALATVPERIWMPLSPEARQNFYNWLSQINGHPVYDCNWLFFHVLVNTGFYKLGLPFDKEQMEAIAADRTVLLGGRLVCGRSRRT